VIRNSYKLILGIAALLLVAALTQPSSLGQAVCPIQFETVSPTSTDTGARSFVLLFRNSTRFKIKGIVFKAQFDDADPAIQPALFVSNHAIAPGAEDSVIWNVGGSPASIKPSFKVWPAMVIFHDNSAWKSSDSTACGFHSSSQAKAAVGPEQTQLASNPDVKMTAAEKIGLIEAGRASLCLVVTNPAGAIVDVDGRKVGQTPIKFVLLKQDSGPRNIDIYKDGYNVIHREFSPSGTTIRITEKLERFSSK
jgi:PEGA domain-containing protein